MKLTSSAMNTPPPHKKNKEKLKICTLHIASVILHINLEPNFVNVKVRHI